MGLQRAQPALITVFPEPLADGCLTEDWVPGLSGGGEMSTGGEMTVWQVLDPACRGVCVCIIPYQRSSQEDLEMGAGEMTRDKIPGTGYLCQAEKGKLHPKQWGFRGALSRGVAQVFVLEGSLWSHMGGGLRERSREGNAGGRGERRRPF